MSPTPTPHLNLLHPTVAFGPQTASIAVAGFDGISQHRNARDEQTTPFAAILAYHTPTIMKGSAIVQGLKSWASALHPQLPLSRKESQRLLNALTSSFRRQLDEVHPPSGGNGGSCPLLEKAGDAGFKTERIQSLYSSSAAYADKHLASVLTNPLLSHGKAAPKKPDVADVMVDLHKDPTKDPIDLLEEYHQKGHATIPIAVACLEAFDKSLKSLPAARRETVLAETSAGRRTLLWVWQNRIYEDDRFVKDYRLAHLMVDFIVQEGHEKYLWEWLNNGMAPGDTKKLPTNIPSMNAKRNTYLWKGVIVHSMVSAKIQHAESLDPAFLALFKALDLKNAPYIPMAASMITIGGAIRNKPKLRLATDGRLYDRFIEVARLPRLSTDMEIGEFYACRAQLLHPRSRSPLPALALLKNIYDHDESFIGWKNLRPYLEQPANVASRRSIFAFFTQTIAQLEDLDRVQDADWVSAVAKRISPIDADRLEQEVEKDRRQNIEDDRQNRTALATIQNDEKPARIPMLSSPVPFEPS